MRSVATIMACAVLAAALAGATVAQGQDGGSEITIVRDGYGVPHVHADSRDALSYGAGYALAQDRLWQMHLFRHIAKGRLSEILGPVVVDIDKSVRFMTYTADERARRFATYPAEIRSGLEAFARGINAWIDEVNGDPTKLPFEFAEFGELPIADWTVDDSVALADVLILSFGAGGGSELRYAALLESLIERHGEAQGREMFDDLIRTDDPDAARTIPDDVAWEGTPTGARAAEAEARRGLEGDARLSLEGSGGGSGGGDPVAGLLAQLELIPDASKAARKSAWLERGLQTIRAIFSFGSNAQLVDENLSETGNTLQTGGPQVGYMVPQWLADFGLHGDGIDVTGMTFAGAGPAVLIGRGPGYAWTTTTGSSDLTDTYVEQLAEGDSRAYVFNGEEEPMECRTETYTFRGAPFDEQEICRTRHGPVTAFDEANGVAYSIRYAWFNREGQTLEGFFGFNFAHSLEDYATSANTLASNHNMFYSDDQGESGYWTPGNHPVRADGVDLRLPQDGTGSSEWQGLRPIEDVPHAVNPERGWLANWNNQPAAGWERERAYSTRDNVDDLFSAFEGGGVADPDGGLVNPDPLWDFNDLNANLRHGAMKHHPHTWYRSALPDPGALDSEEGRAALDAVTRWDGFLVDRDGDGRYDSAGERIVDRWLSVLRQRVFADDLGGDAGIARVDSELWHVVSPESTLALGFDWLNGADGGAVAAAAFDQAARDIAAEAESGDPADWRRPIRRERYQHLDADFPADLAAATACDAAADTPLGCPAVLDPANDTGLPGDIPEHIRMDRGTYNHIVQFLDPPEGGSAPIGASRVRAGSVIPPGQSGFISLLGQEDEHFEDQLELYREWRYKPMPLTPGEIAAHAESTERLTYPE